MVGHRTIAASLAILDDVASLHARRLDDIASLHAQRRPALHVPTASLGFLARQAIAASDGSRARVSLCLARSTVTKRPSQELPIDGLAVRTAIGMVGHRAIAASLA